MQVKVTIETWNDEWHFEIEDKETGETLNAGYYPTFKQCVSECNRYLSQLSAAEQSVQPTVLCTCFKNNLGTIERPAQNCPVHNPHIG
jgi:hypothetical protein